MLSSIHLTQIWDLSKTLSNINATIVAYSPVLCLLALVRFAMGEVNLTHCFYFSDLTWMKWHIVISRKYRKILLKVYFYSNKITNKLTISHLLRLQPTYFYYYDIIIHFILFQFFIYLLRLLLVLCFYITRIDYFINFITFNNVTYIYFYSIVLNDDASSENTTKRLTI